MALRVFASRVLPATYVCQMQFIVLCNSLLCLLTFFCAAIDSRLAVVRPMATATPQSVVDAAKKVTVGPTGAEKIAALQTAAEKLQWHELSTSLVSSEAK